MGNVFSVVTLGFLLGMRHATDADHVIAVTTIVARNRSNRYAAVIGAWWGLGHMLTILTVGGGIILLGWVIPVRIGLSMEFSVGVMLILLGVLNLTGLLERLQTILSRGGSSLQTTYTPGHPHRYADECQFDASEPRSLGWLDRHFGRLALFHILRPLIVGIVHGLAGSAAVALLILTTIRNPGWAILYLFVFGIGTIAGMSLLTAAIAAPFAYTNRPSSRFRSGMKLASGLISVGFGFFIVYHTGFVDGLFTSHPQWIPR
jgi:high-affinity nickel permease